MYYKELINLDATEVIAETKQYLYRFTNCFTRSSNYRFDGIDLNFLHFTEHVPSCQQLFFTLGLVPVRYMIFILGSTEVAIHRDQNTNLRTVRINIPILNCEYSETVFFKMKAGKTYSPNVISGDYEFADSVILKYPTALAVGEAHQVRMLQPHHPRISLSVFFEGDDVADLIFGACTKNRT